jgi:replicative DNA helicase
MRTQPNAAEIEKHIVGAAMLETDAAGIMLEKLQAADFYDPRHAELYRAVSAIRADQRQADALAVVDWLKAAGKTSAAGGDAYLMEIMAEVVSGANIVDHAAIVRGHSIRRGLIRSLGESLENAWDSSKSTEEALGAAQSKIMDLGGAAVGERGLKSLRKVFSEASEEWQASASGKVIGVKTGLPSYDEMICGFRPGTLNVLAARPGMGKSMLALQVALQCRQPVALYSLEMMAMEQAERLISQRVEGVTGDGLRSANILMAKAAEIKQAIAEISGSPLWICDNTNVSTIQMLGQCRRLKSQEGLGLIVVDYLQLLQTAEKHDSRVREVGAVSKFLKRMANELQVPVIAIASLSRDCEKRDDKRPIQSDLRESGEIESDAHTITMIYRHSEYDKSFAADKSLSNVTEIIVRKNRSGRKGTRIFMFDGIRARFYEMAADDKQRYVGMFKQNTSREIKSEDIQ